MERETVYIYLIRNGKVVQDEAACEQVSKSRYKLCDRKRFAQTISIGQLDICERNRVVSFEDNLPKYRQMIVEDLEKRVEDAEKRLVQQKQILESIKNND